MSTEANNDPLEQLINTAWMETVRGTWAESDRKIFANGFRQGYQARQPISPCTCEIYETCSQCRGTERDMSQAGGVQ